MSISGHLCGLLRGGMEVESGPFRATAVISRVVVKQVDSLYPLVQSRNIPRVTAIGIRPWRISRKGQTTVGNHLTVCRSPVCPIFDIINLTDWYFETVNHISPYMWQGGLFTKDVATAFNAVLQRNRLYRQASIFIDNQLRVVSTG